MGSMAAEILYGSLMDPNRQHVNTILEPKLIVRESVRSKPMHAPQK
jgi:DNA-binding LacI/PurR family transcriptional regulator